MVQISTLLATALAGISYVSALPSQYGRIPGIESSTLAKRAVVIPNYPDGIRAAGNQGPVPIRRDFDTFAQDATALNLYLLALSRMQAKPQNDPTSYYMIAGIHGRPYIAWDGVTGGNNNGGYCTHADILFLTWHRPYLALYESILYAEVQKIASEFRRGSADSTAALASAQTWRMPYWDWASKIRIPELIGNRPRVQVNHPTQGRIEIDNPLYSYKYNFTSPQQQAEHLPDARFRASKQTGRVPFATVNERLGNIGNNVRNRVYNLLTAYTQFAHFSNKATTQSVNGNLDSLEAIHDVIHATVGGSDFEMGFVDYAAMDNLFFLHHTNVDRIFAIWQAMHPDSSTNYISQDYTNRFGTYAIRAGSTSNVQSPLPPFRNSDNSFYTSEQVKSTKAFGYVYPETVDWDKPANNFVAWVVSKVNELYGANSPAGALTSVSSETNRMSSTRALSSSTSTRASVSTTPSSSSVRPSSSSSAAPTTAPAAAVTTSAPPAVQPTTTTTAPATPIQTPPVTPRPPSNNNNQQPTCANTPWWMWIWKGMWNCFWESRSNRNQKRDSLYGATDTGYVGSAVENIVDPIKNITSNIGDNIGNYTSTIVGIIDDGAELVGDVISDTIDHIPALADLVPIASSLIVGDEYLEYIAQIKAANNALNGTFTVYFFLGDYNHEDPLAWPVEKNLVGSHSAFTNLGGGHYFIGSGSVPLTAAIINLIAMKQIANLGRDAVLPYLKKNLRWEVATAAGEAVSSKDVQQLKVSIVSTPVRLPCVDGAIPSWGKPTTEYGITEGKDGGLCKGDEAM